MKAWFDGWGLITRGNDGKKGELERPCRGTMLSVSTFENSSWSGFVRVNLGDTEMFVRATLDEFTKDYDDFMNAYLLGRSAL